jgi:hypothetical protein
VPWLLGALAACLPTGLLSKQVAAELLAAFLCISAVHAFEHCWQSTHMSVMCGCGSKCNDSTTTHTTRIFCLAAIHSARWTLPATTTTSWRCARRCLRHWLTQWRPWRPGQQALPGGAQSLPAAATVPAGCNTTELGCTVQIFACLLLCARQTGGTSTACCIQSAQLSSQMPVRSAEIALHMCVSCCLVLLQLDHGRAI